MTIASTLTTKQYVSTGVNTQFAFPNKIFSANDLAVTIFDLAGNSYIFTNFANSALGLTFSVQNVDVDTGCTVVLSAPFTLNWTIDIRSLVAETQSTSIKNQGQFLPELHEEAFDRATRQIQDLLRLTYTFGIHAPDIEVTPWPALPLIAARKGLALIFDPVTGLPTVGIPTTQTITQGFIGLLLYPQTAAEIAAGATPTTYAYNEGDIRRYNATTGATDNSVAINLALAVSAAGGSAAFIPPGTWKITSPLNPAGNCSMVGAGKSQSVIAPQACGGLPFPIWSPASPTRRVFSGFSIIGTGTSAQMGISASVSPSAVYGITFSDIGVQNFQYAAYMSGFRWTTWTGCIFYNNKFGFYFNGQNTNTEIIGCHLISQSQVRGDGSWGISFQQLAGNTTQSTQILGTYLYGFDIGINCLLAFETQIIGCDISQNLTTAVNIQSTNGGFWLQSCWVETNAAAITTAINVANITPTTTGHVVIEKNYINATTVFAGSNGMIIGNSNNGAKITGNKIIGFDQGVTIGASAGLTFRDNTINCVTSVYSATSYALNLASTLSPDLIIGPNYIVGGTPVAATMANASANIGVPSSTVFPVGSPVQFDAAVNGFFISVTYYVLTSAANVITVGAVPAGAAIVATGNTAINVFQAPLPLTTAAGTPSPGFQFFARGSFIGTLSDPAVSGPVDWTAQGYAVEICPRAVLTGTGTTTTLTMTGVPAMLWPLTGQQNGALVINNSISGYGTFTMQSNGVFTAYWTFAGTNYTIGGTKALGKLPMRWLYT